VTYIEGVLAENQTESQIIADIEADICADIPVFQQECDGYCVQYVPLIIQYLENSGSPDVACQDIGACSTGPAEMKPKKYYERRT